MCGVVTDHGRRIVKVKPVDDRRRRLQLLRLVGHCSGGLFTACEADRVADARILKRFAERRKELL